MVGAEKPIGARAEPGPLGRGPQLSLFELTMGATLTQAIAVACRLGLPDHLADEPLSLEELAFRADAPAEVVGRIVRVLRSVDIVSAADDRYGLTRFGEPLRSDSVPSLRPWAIMAGASWFWGPLGRMEDSLTEHCSGFEAEYGTDVFAYLASGQVPGAQVEYDQAMGGVMTSEATEISGVYQFADRRHILDVGGGNGTLCLEILAAHPHLTGAVLDQPTVVSRAAERADHPAAARCTWHPGDFFDAVPSGADTYLLSRILHDWNDDRSTRILDNIRSGMADDGRLLVVEQLLDEDTDPFTPLCDLNMAALYGTGERTRDEMGRLIERSDLTLVGATRLSSGRFLIEARPAGPDGGG